MLYKTEGIVLRTKNLGEADKLVTIYTRKRGKVTAVARGSRRIRNRLLGPTQVFTHGRYLLFEGKTLDTMSQAEIINSFQSLRDDLTQMAYAMYIAELIDRFIEEHDPNEEIFTLLLNTLTLGRTPGFETSVRSFELRLMKLLGYEPQVYNCLGCGTVPQQQLWFSREGGIVCGNCAPQFQVIHPLSRGAWELIKRLLDWEWARISILRPSFQALTEIEAINRDYLDYRLEQPLKSLEFLQTLRDFQSQEVEGNGK